MPNNISRSGERIVRLLLLLINAEEGVTREEIYQAVPGYKSSTEEAQRRCLECDINSLEAAGVQILRQTGSGRQAHWRTIEYKAVLPTASSNASGSLSALQE